MSKLDSKEQYAQTVCYFLAEQLRTRRVELKRCAEIAQKVLENINLMETEEDFLKLIKQLSGDFEELVHLEARVQMHLAESNRQMLEAKVREFAIAYISRDLPLVTSLLEEAMKQESSLPALCAKFPPFNEFNQISHARTPKS